MNQIVFLRGINVSGQKRFLKSEQQELLDYLGFKNSQVYLHTGNWLIESNQSPTEVSQKIRNALIKKMGWEVPVLIVSASNLKVIFNDCPFSEVLKKKSYFILLSEIPSEENIKKAQRIQYPNETIKIQGPCIYYFATHGYGKSKFSINTFEKILEVNATSRNYSTISKMLSLVS